MEIINISLNGGLISLRITIKTANFWSYVYADRGTNYTGQTNDPMPKTHGLGSPTDLQLQIDNLFLKIINGSDNSQDYSILYEWLQDGAVVHQYPTDGTQNGTLTVANPRITFSPEFEFLAQ